MHGLVKEWSKSESESGLRSGRDRGGKGEQNCSNGMNKWSGVAGPPKSLDYGMLLPSSCFVLY